MVHGIARSIACLLVHYSGYPTHWLKLLGPTHLDYQVMVVQPINRFRHPATRLFDFIWTWLDDSGASLPTIDKSCKYYIIYKVTMDILIQGLTSHLNQEVTRLPVRQGSWVPNTHVDLWWYRSMGYSETRPVFDIIRHNGASMKYLLGDLHLLIP
jgi:hypothetical protein